MLPNSYLIKYPPRGSWQVRDMSHGRASNGPEYYHGGYYSELVKPCPCCKRYPVFQEYIYEATPPDEKAKIFIGVCPSCELRTKKPARLKEAVAQWQNRIFSKDSLLVCHRPRLDTFGCELLCDKVLDVAIADALFFAQQRQTAVNENFESYGNDLKKLETFFRESVFMYNMDPDGVISDIRRALYPDLPPKERTKIPNHLVELYKGKETERAWREKNSSKQQSVADTAART